MVPLDIQKEVILIINKENEQDDEDEDVEDTPIEDLIYQHFHDTIHKCNYYSISAKNKDLDALLPRLKEIILSSKPRKSEQIINILHRNLKVLLPYNDTSEEIPVTKSFVDKEKENSKTKRNHGLLIAGSVITLSFSVLIGICSAPIALPTLSLLLFGAIGEISIVSLVPIILCSSIGTLSIAVAGFGGYKYAKATDNIWDGIENKDFDELIDQKTNNIIYEGPIKNKTPNGKGILYYPNSKVMGHITVENGILSGFQKIYDPNGILIFDGKIENNRYTGDLHTSKWSCTIDVLCNNKSK